VIDGVTTTLPLHEFVLSHPDFIRGGVTTSWFGPTWEKRSEQRMESVR
jgi:acetyl-CoA carboxylase biotin carboxylase subunit